MFKFRKRTHEPLADVRSAKRWLASLPANDPLGVQRELKAALDALSGRTARRNPARLAAVFAADAHTDSLVRTLMTQYADHADRSTKIENQLWHALFDLTQSYQACYAAFGREINDQAPRGRWPALLPELIARQLRHMAQDAKIRLYRCEPWIPAKWAELHATFTRACTLQIERQPLLLTGADGPTTIEREYLVVLLFQQGDPGNLTPRQIEWFAGQLGEWCQPLRLSLEPLAAATFYVDLASSTGLKRRSLGALEGRVLFADLRPVHGLLQQNRTELEQALKIESRSDAARRQREHLDLFIKLASRLDPEFKPLTRRGERIPASGAVDAVVGFANISAFLSDDKVSTTTQLNTGRSYASTLDLAVFGRSRVQVESNPLEDARRRVTAFSAPGGPWELKDMSVSGFRLHAPMSVATEVTLSMLVAIHRRGEDPWVMGIVRRMRRLSADNAEIGLQLIANSLTGAEMVEQRAAKATDYSVDGEPPRVGRLFRALYLTFNRRAGDPAVQSLIVPPVEYQPARRYNLHVAGSVQAIRYGRLLEQHTDWVWTVIDPIEPDDASTPATTG
jgi:cyclic-di-GMP-binding protein